MKTDTRASTIGPANLATTLERVRRILESEIGLSQRVDPEDDLLHDLQLDSLQQMNLVVLLENHFEICLEPEDEAGLVTVADVVKLIDRK